MRTFLIGTISFFIIASCSSVDNKKLSGTDADGPLMQDSLCIDPMLKSKLDETLAPFYHGVASGDPTQNAAIIWTRITLTTPSKTIPIRWEISLNPNFKTIEQTGEQSTTINDDYTLKIDVENLKPGTEYFYRFQHKEATSITGKLQTLPLVSDKMKIAFASCSNYEWGHFNAYGAMANDEDIDLIVHLGDYIYEYGTGTYGDTSLGRTNVPLQELISLQDYRTRYALYRLDKNLIRAHQNKPFITTWDDHEIANNSYMDGAENHQDSTEGEWSSRKNVGIQAYYEWMPVRAPKEKLYRSFSIGNLINLVILDTRISGRTAQIYDHENVEYQDQSRSILGQPQYNWLTSVLKENHKWKIIGNQVPLGPMLVPTEEGHHPYMDGWDGYPSERNKLLNFIADNKIDNLIFMTGDYHSSFALETPLGTKTIASEFIVPSINSSNYDEHTDSATVLRAQDGYLQLNPHIRHCNLTDHGYVNLTIKKEHVYAEFIYLESVDSFNLSLKPSVDFIVPSGKIMDKK